MATIKVPSTARMFGKNSKTGERRYREIAAKSNAPVQDPTAAVAAPIQQQQPPNAESGAFVPSPMPSPKANMTVPEIMGSDEELLFTQLKAGTMLAHPDVPEWNAMYVNGQATPAQKRAWSRWMAWKDTQTMTNEQLYGQLESGAMKVNSSQWNDMKQNGQMTAQQQYALDKYQQNQVVKDVNQQMSDVADILQSAKEPKRTSAKMEDIYKQIDGLSVEDQYPSATELYKDLIVDNPNIKGLTEQYETLKGDLTKLRGDKLYLKKDILELSQGEAPQSYINALAARRTEDLAREEFNVLVELDMVQGQLESEKEMATNILQYTLQDQERQYQRVKDMLNYNMDKAKTEAQLKQQQLQNELEVQKMLFTIPEGETLTLSTGTYKGRAKNENIKAVQWTDPNGDTYLLGLDANTGEEIYKTYLGNIPSTTQMEYELNLKKLGLEEKQLGLSEKQLGYEMSQAGAQMALSQQELGLKQGQLDLQIRQLEQEQANLPAENKLRRQEIAVELMKLKKEQKQLLSGNSADAAQQQFENEMKLVSTLGGISDTKKVKLSSGTYTGLKASEAETASLTPFEQYSRQAFSKVATGEMVVDGDYAYDANLYNAYFDFQEYMKDYITEAKKESWSPLSPIESWGKPDYPKLTDYVTLSKNSKFLATVKEWNKNFLANPGKFTTDKDGNIVFTGYQPPLPTGTYVGSGAWGSLPKT